MPAMLVVDLIH
jgi:hypothetical protein